MNETQTLARFVVESRWGDIPQPVRHDAKRALLNWLGCALGGCRDETVERALAAFDEFSGPRKATLIGRHKKTDVLHAALINAIASNILDFDDTHMRTVIHPTVPVAATLCALAEHHPATGAQFVQALDAARIRRSKSARRSLRVSSCRISRVSCRISRRS